MKDEELHAWWPDLGNLVAELRRAGQSEAADRLAEAAAAGGTSGEILSDVGVVLRDHRALRSRLGAAGTGSWDAVMADVDRAYPGTRWSRWLTRLKGR